MKAHSLPQRSVWTRADLEARDEQQIGKIDHPKGALLFILVYLLILTGLWTNVYLHLWGG